MKKIQVFSEKMQRPLTFAFDRPTPAMAGATVISMDSWSRGTYWSNDDSWSRGTYWTDSRDWNRGTYWTDGRDWSKGTYWTNSDGWNRGNGSWTNGSSSGK